MSHFVSHFTAHSHLAITVLSAVTGTACALLWAWKQAIRGAQVESSFVTFAVTTPASQSDRQSAS